MKQQTIVISAAIFILIVAGMFGFAYLKKSEIKSSTDTGISSQSTSSSSVPYPSVTMITAKHYYQDGVHTFAGEIPLPTPCDLLEATSTASNGGSVKNVVLDFTVINNAQVCEQVVTSARFKVSYTGDAQMPFSARFMGREVKLNLIPAGAGEKPEDFQLYQKG